MKIRTKFFVTNILIVLFLLGSLSYIWVKRSTDLIMDNIAENTELSLSQFGANVSNKLQYYEEIANTLYSDNTLQKEFMQHYDDLREAYDIYFTKQQPFERAILTTKDVYRIDIYTDNPTYVFSNVHLLDEAAMDSEWYGRVMEGVSGSYWTPTYASRTNQTKVFSFKKRLNNLVKSAKLVVSVEIHPRVLQELIQEESKDKRYIFALNDGTVLMDSAANERVESIDQLPFYEQIAHSPKGSLQYSEGEHSYLILHKTLSGRETVEGMKVISFVSLDEIMPKVKEMRGLAVMLFAVSCILSVIVIFIFSVGLTRRISELSLVMRRVDKENFTSSVEVRGNDEISALGQMFNQMVIRIRQLITEVYQAEIDRREMALRTKEVELYALQTQINPHFLFNILNMIRGKLLMNGDRDTAKAIGLLAKSFRMMLRGGGQTIGLAQEVEFIDNYLQLQKYRYPDKFDYVIAISEEDQAMEIPRLCLQPLVENAISHGIELKEGGSFIAVDAERREDRLFISVRDDGLGIPEERLAEIQSWLAEERPLSKDAHIGLYNVDRRLKYLYGDTFGLQVSSKEGAGTTVTLSLPIKSEPGGKADA